MHYTIIANPVAGTLNADQKRSVLAPAAALLKADIRGLDTTTVHEFACCAQEAAEHCDVLTVAGGDGTLSEIINCIDTAAKTIAYLPLGSGNAMRYALKYKGGLCDIAARIRDSNVSVYDLIQCDNQKRAFMASIGIDGQVIRLRDQFRKKGISGFKSYFKAIPQAYFGSYLPPDARMAIDGHETGMKKVLSLIVTKQPYFGFGMQVAPRAQFDDHKLHIVCIHSGIPQSLIGWATSFTIGNRTGRHSSGRKLRVQLKQPSILQIDGDAGWYGDAFAFEVLPGALRIKC
ncbi:diacylglycerol kinase family protein [Desulfococcaceae bacterium HSG7]|nr:diacylglycerol kinase family protein [Desulfococcaceae bacterium HSG7]